LSDAQMFIHAAQCVLMYKALVVVYFF